MMLVIYSVHCLFLGMVLGVVFSSQPNFNDRPPLLAATKFGLSLYDEGTWEEHILYRENNYKFDYIYSLDMHYNKGFVFWVEAVTDRVSYRRRYYTKRGKLSGNSLTSITVLSIHNESIHHLVVDWVHDKYYWLDRLEHAYSIKSAKLDGSDVREVLELVKPRKGRAFMRVEIDPLNRWLYFMTFLDETKVNLERVDMDGNNREVVSKNICKTQPLCDLLFEVDHTTGRVYWTNYFSSKIYSVGSDLQDRRTHDFDNYAISITTDITGNPISYRTLEMYTRFAYKNNIYFSPFTDLKKEIYRLDTINTTMTTLPVGVHFQQVKLFHASAQPAVIATDG